jgi:hypothetical protein
MSECEKPDLGKFEGNRCAQEAETLYGGVQESWQKEELGDCEGFGWYGLILLDADEWGEDKHLHSPAYIVGETCQGFFGVTGYESHEAAKEDWAKLEADYEAWEENQEE